METGGVEMMTCFRGSADKSNVPHWVPERVYDRILAGVPHLCDHQHDYIFTFLYEK